MFVADLHIHSKYSRATSSQCVPEVLEFWARRKGLHLLGTGDFTHPKWREELREKLVPAEEGLYRLKEDTRIKDNTAGEEQPIRFIVSGEISSIYKKNGKVRKVHNVILLPSLEHAQALSLRLEASFNLHSDGRPILGLDSRDLLEVTLEACPEAIFIPAHIWTPHFSLFGAYSGFDRIEECFEDLTGHIHALETGLSSDPLMNWRLSMLDRFTLVSNSDAHSPANLAREANMFDTELSYPHISRALDGRDAGAFYGTIDFFPEEGKYHWDGHRACGVCQRPAETKALNGICPVCGGRIIIGVLNRVEALADRPEGFIPPLAKHFESLVPLHEVIAASLNISSAGVKVKAVYEDLISSLGPELYILREAPLEDIRSKAGFLVYEGIRRLRMGKVDIQPGFDGEYGKIKLFQTGEANLLLGQLSFIEGEKDPLLLTTGKGSRKSQAPQALPEEPIPEPAAEPSPSNMPYGLDPEQWAAVCAREPHIAVIAGPGTGKTKTLVSRAIYLVENCGVDPSHITAVTFTNKAAGEMRDRLNKQLKNKRAVKAMTVGTFHAICLQLLSAKRGRESLTIMDDAQALSVIDDILKELHLKDAAKDVQLGISLLKCGAQPEEKGSAVPENVYELYCEKLQSFGVLDYDDILVKALELFEKGEHLPPSYEHILVDEFQDINDIQYRLINAWSKKSASVFVIGDPDQSVYGFRGANPHCFGRLFEEFPLSRLVRLTRNYRSTMEILSCAGSVLQKDAFDAPQLEAARGSGVPVRLYDAEDDYAQAQFVAGEIKSMVGGIDMLEAHGLTSGCGKKHTGGQGRGFSDIALLYRTNRQAQTLERCLSAEGIPYRVTGREDFLAEPNVRKCVAFFRFLANPEDLVSLRLCLQEAGLNHAESMNKVLEDYGAGANNLSALAGVLERAGMFSGSIQKWLELASKYEPLILKGNPAELVEAWANDNGFMGCREMELIINSAVMTDSMASFLANLTLGQEGDLHRSGGRRYTQDAVSLMSLHASKGLEFPVVFLCGVTQGLIPYVHRDGSCNLEEERRLFYVGMTRAQDELILMTSKEPSRFLAALPPEFIAASHAFERKRTQTFEQFSFIDA